MVTVPTIKVDYAAEHEVYEHQVSADTAVLQHLHHPVHGCGWMLFYLQPGDRRVSDCFIPGELTDIDNAVDRARRRLSPQHTGTPITKPPADRHPALRHCQSASRKSASRKAHQEEVLSDPPPTHRHDAASHRPPRRA
jgi:hypothetical protein